jgi:hypothetical protein
MRTMNPVYPNEPRVQYSDADPIVVNPSAPSSDIILLSPGTRERRIAPGQIFILDPVVQASRFVIIGGSLRLTARKKFLHALFFRNDTGRGDFQKVASFDAQEVGNEDWSKILFSGQIDTEKYANLFPGFFMAGFRNPKANPEITVFDLFLLNG